MNRISAFAMLFAVLLALSPAAGLAGATAAPDGGTDIQNVSFSDGVVNPDLGVEFGEVGDIDPNLEGVEGTQEVVLRLGQIDRAALQGVTGDAAIDKLKSHAAASQQNLLRYVKQTSGVEVVNRFWIANAVLVEVDTTQVSIKELTSVEGVESAHANFKLSLPEAQQSASSSEGASATEGANPTDYNTTYGLDQINASEVWSEYNTMGEGVGVAVLDTGVDPDHPDIDIQDDNFVEVTSSGEIENVDPYDSAYHGTHTSGTVVGGNASGEYIGVAPEATLYHGLVIPGGGGSFSQVAAGMEWAANESGVDIVSMSLGAPGYSTQMIEPTENIQAAGKILVASAGNSYAGSSGSPGNVYGAVAAGASNEAGNIADFSSGETIDTSAAWGSAAPEDWPDEYVVPDYAAPGVAVKSAEPGGTYQELSGTSMSAPHIAGALALMQSAAGDLDQSTVEETLTETAWAPVEDPDPIRYGDGIIDIKAATDMVALEQGINGTVTAANDGEPVEGASVMTDQGFEATTNADGEYTVLAEPGTVNVTAEAFGYETTTSSVEVENETYATLNLSLAPALGVEQTSGQVDAIMGGESVSATFNAMNADNVTVDLTGDYSTDNATLYVNGEMASFGDAVSVSDGTVNVSVMTASGTSGDISLEHTFEGEGDSQTFTTGPTEVFEELTNVGVVHTGDYGADVQSALQDELSGMYQIDTVMAEDAADVAGDYDVFVVQDLDESDVSEFVSATEAPTTGVVYLDNWGSGSDAIAEKSVVTGEPASTGDGFSGSMNPHFVNVAGEHPIFDGVDTADGVEIHTATFSDHSWFSGSSGEVLADVTDKSASVDGSAIAYYEDTNTVLASSLGRESFVGNGDFTEDADTILGNTVEYAYAETPTIMGEVIATNATADPGETAMVTVKTTAPNVGGYELNLSFDPSKAEVTNVIGMDLGNPAVNINNDEGWVKVAQTQADGTDEPNLYKVKFNVSMVDRDDWMSVEFVDTHQLVYPNGTEMYTMWDHGMVNIANLAGDVNGDGAVTIADAQLVQQYIVGNPIEGPFDEEAADVNNDGQITSADVTAILQIIVGNEDPEDYNDANSQLAAQPGTAAPIAA